MSLANQQAIDLRKRWMRQMGLSTAEIAEHCGNSSYPISVDEELENAEAMKRIEAREEGLVQ